MTKGHAGLSKSPWGKNIGPRLCKRSAWLISGGEAQLPRVLAPLALRFPVVPCKRASSADLTTARARLGGLLRGLSSQPLRLAVASLSKSRSGSEVNGCPLCSTQIEVPDVCNGWPQTPRTLVGQKQPVVDVGFAGSCRCAAMNQSPVLVALRQPATMLLQSTNLAACLVLDKILALDMLTLREHTELAGDVLDPVTHRRFSDGDALRPANRANLVTHGSRTWPPT